jgi:hypothetical protein
MFGWPMEEEAKLEFTITVNWRREDGSIATTQLGRWTAALAARPKMWVCNSPTPGQFSAGYRRLWSANNCSDTSNLYGHVLAVIIVATERIMGGGVTIRFLGGNTRPGQRRQFEILTGRVETSSLGGEAFAVVRDLDPYAKRRVQAILRRCGRGQDTDVRAAYGEDGLRGSGRHLVWEGMRASSGLVPCCATDRSNRKGIPVSPYGDDFQERLAAHWANLNSLKWVQHALAHPEANSERFESIEAKLDELRSYLYANRESVRGYAEAYRNVERISTAHVESTVNQLINWRMCKKHQMG